MKVYVSGPMTGIVGFNYPAFEDAARRLREAGLDVVSPHEVNPLDGPEQEWGWYIRRDVVALMECDAIALLPGYEGSRGSRLECDLGRALDMDIRPLDDWLSDRPCSTCGASETVEVSDERQTIRVCAECGSDEP